MSLGCRKVHSYAGLSRITKLLTYTCLYPFQQPGLKEAQYPFKVGLPGVAHSCLHAIRLIRSSQRYTVLFTSPLPDEQCGSNSCIPRLCVGFFVLPGSRQPLQGLTTGSLDKSWNRRPTTSPTSRFDMERAIFVGLIVCSSYGILLSIPFLYLDSKKPKSNPVAVSNSRLERYSAIVFGLIQIGFLATVDVGAAISLDKSQQVQWMEAACSGMLQIYAGVNVRGLNQNPLA